MRFVVYGAGAVGGVVGAHLFEQGHDVTLVARGQNARAMTDRGLTIESTDGPANLNVTVVQDPAGIAWTGQEVVLLTVKSQDTDGALQRLAAIAPPSVPVVCLQNGVANESAALRRFPNVYGVCVMCPAGHLEPGVVIAYSSPITALLDIGRYPSGVDETAAGIAAAFESSTMESLVRPDIMRWKYAKLLMNLTNAVDAICGPEQRGGVLGRAVREEGVVCLRAAGIDFASEEEDKERRGNRLRLGDIAGRGWRGSSSWQSLARRAGSIEADYLNGEIVLLGRVRGVPTPVNELVQRLANRMATDRRPPGSMDVDEVVKMLASG